MPNGTAVDLVLPKFLTVMDKLEVVKDVTQAEVTVTITEGTTPVVYRVLSAPALACADRAYRPFFLSPTPAGTKVFKSYEVAGNDGGIAYMCLKLKDPTSGLAKYFCGKGMMGEGVTGYALKRGTQSPRPFYISSLTWGNNTWTHHFEFLNAGLGSIAARFPVGSQTGYALDEAWNLNPRDTHSDGTSKRAAYLGALALKTSTNRNGVYVSPYKNANVTGAKAFVASELNQCEPGYKTYPDVAADGTLEQTILPKLWVNDWYANPYNGCSWAQDWALPTAAQTTVSGCTTFDIKTANPFQLGLNLHDSAQRRCPTWQACDVGSFCCAASVASGSRATCVAKSDGTAWCWGTDMGGSLGANVRGQRKTTGVQVVVQDGSPLRNVIEIGGHGGSHFCARHADGTAWCWGINFAGNGTAYAKQVAGLASVQQLAAGTQDQHDCAVKTGGTLWCWGINNVGQLGNGTSTSSTTPVQVSALGSMVVEVATGAMHTCARKSDGTAWCWEQTAAGSLARATQMTASAPGKSRG
ncbi:MAG: hypothetical protein IPG96_17370 [Proteobacteria bacterium]|nr:hypothetical protein [Pseudomonadota bacterium]